MQPNLSTPYTLRRDHAGVPTPILGDCTCAQYQWRYVRGDGRMDAEKNDAAVFERFTALNRDLPEIG
jgi:hypothetical protein